MTSASDKARALLARIEAGEYVERSVGTSTIREVLAELSEAQAEVARLKPRASTELQDRLEAAEADEKRWRELYELRSEALGVANGAHAEAEAECTQLKAEVARLKQQAPDPIVPDDETTLRQIARHIRAEHKVAAEHLITAAELLRHFKPKEGRDG